MFPPSNESMYPCLVKFCWLFFEPLQHCSFHFLVTGIMSFLLNPLSRIQRNDSLQILNLVRSKEDMVKLYTRMTQSSPLSWCLCVVEYCHAVGGHYRLASTLSLQSTILVFSNLKFSLYIYIRYIWFGLFGFYGISTIVGYLMPNPLYT